MSQWVSRIASVSAWAAAHPRAALLIALAVVSASVLGVLRIDMAGSLSAMIGSDSPASASLARMADDYHTGDELLLLCTLDPGVTTRGGAVFERFGESVVGAIRTDPEASAMVASIRYRQDAEFSRLARAFILPAAPYYMSERGFEEFRRRLTSDGMLRQLRRAEAMLSAPGAMTGPIVEQTLRDPLRLAELLDGSVLATDGGTPVAGLGPADLPPMLLSIDGRTLMIRITGVRPVNDLAFSRALTDRVEAIAESLGHDGLGLQLAGGYAIATTTSRGIRADLILSLTVAVALVHILFFVLYRHPLAPLLIGGIAGIGILAGFGVQGLGHPVITPLSASIAAMLAGLGVDYGVHLLAHYQSHRPGAADTVEATRRSVGRVGGAIMASALTTAIGFGSMVFSGVIMLRGFAVIGVACLLGCLISVLFFMPASLRLMDRVRAHRTPRLSGVGGLIARRARVCLMIGLTVLAAQVVVLGALGWAPRLETDLSTMHPRPNAALDATETLASRFHGHGEWLPIEVVAASPGAMVRAAHEVNDALLSDAGKAIGVTRTFGVPTLIPDPARSEARRAALLGFDPATVRVEFQAAVGQSVFADDAFEGYDDAVAELVRAPVPTVEELREFPTIAMRMLADPDGDARSLLAAEMRGSLSDRATRDAAIEGVRRLLAPIPGATLSGVTAVAYDLERAMRGDLTRLAATAGLLIALCLLLALRRPTLVLLALIPLVAGALTMLTAMVVAGLRLNVLNGAAVPLLLGITVDAGVILVALYAANGPGRRVDFGSSVQAVIAASATTLIGFGAVCLSSTPAIRSLGMLTCVGMVGSTLGALLILVPILVLRSPGRTPRRIAPP